MKSQQSPLVNIVLPSLMAGSNRLKCIYQQNTAHAVMDCLGTLLYNISPARGVPYSTGQHVLTETSNWVYVSVPQ